MISPLPFNPFINPAYSARMSDERQPVMARLPLAPMNASPVPSLTSLYHDPVAGDYGDRRYPGNCGGNLIRDLLCYFGAMRVFDPMSGSGTCSDVCRELGVDSWSGDIHRGFDICEPTAFHGDARILDRRTFDFAWLHPPYWRQKLYADDPRDLSRAPTLGAFLDRYQLAIAHSAHVLAPGGKLAILMGDYQDREAGFVPLTYHTKRLAFACGLRQCGTDIIRFSHGASSSRKVYRSAFIPGLHDVCMIFEKAQ